MEPEEPGAPRYHDDASAVGACHLRPGPSLPSRCRGTSAWRRISGSSKGSQALKWVPSSTFALLFLVLCLCAGGVYAQVNLTWQDHPIEMPRRVCSGVEPIPLEAGAVAVGSALELFHAVNDENVFHIRVLADIFLAELGKILGDGAVPKPTEIFGESASIPVAQGRIEGLLMSESLPGDAAGPKQYNETGEGSVIATRKGNAAKPAAEALQPATTFRWEAWRHDSLYSWLPPIKRQLSIQGACSDPSGNSKPLCILDGGEQNRIFSVVANGNVTFTNIEFRGGSTRSLAPEDPTSSEDLEVEHLGSAILMDYLSAGSFTSCVFNFNEANRNVPVSGVSGGLGPNRVLGPGAGGALGLQGSLRVLVISSIFKNNSATMGPCDIVAQAYSTLVVDQSSFSPCFAESQSTYSVGLYPLGSVFQTSMSMYNSEFVGYSDAVKGGLFLTGGSIATLVNVRFIGLQADGDFTLAPFVVANQASAYLSSVNVEGCQFIGKRGTRGASAILLIGNSGLELHHSSIKSNKGTSAAIVVNDSRMNVMATKMSNNRGETVGSCIAATDSVVQIFESEVTNSRAPRGGCIWATGGLIYVWRSLISGCVATRQGGGLMLDNSGDSSGLTLGALYNSTVQNCSAPYSGGGLLATDLLDISPSPGNLSPSVDQRVNLVVSSCVFAHNTVGGIGAALLSTSSAIFLDNTRFLNNNAGVLGDDMWLRSSKMIMSNVQSDRIEATGASCNLVMFDDSCDVYTTDGAQGDQDVLQCGIENPEPTCSPMQCSINRRPTWPLSSSCLVQNADYLPQVNLECDSFNTLRGHEFAFSRKTPPRTCGSTICDTQGLLSMELCTNECPSPEETVPERPPDTFGAYAPPGNGICSTTMPYNYTMDSSLPVDPLAGNTSDKPVSDEGLSSVVVGVVAVDVQNIQKLVGNWGVTSFLYGNIVGSGQLCMRDSCISPVNNHGVFLQALNASHISVWYSVLSVRGSGQLSAGPAACDGQGNMYMVLRHELLPDREENTSGPAFLTMQRIVNGKEDNQTVPLDLADRSCFGIKFVVDGTVELIFQVNNDGPGGLQCNGLDVSADGSNVAIAGTFLGRVSLQGLVLTSSFNGEEPSGFAMVLEHDSDRPMMSPKFAQPINIGERGSSILVTSASLSNEDGNLDVVGSYLGYLEASWNPNAELSEFHSLPSMFALRMAAYSAGPDAPGGPVHPGQVQWLTSLSSAETTSLATVLVDWDSKLYIAGFYHVTGHRMHWLAACLSTQGEVLWVQFDNTSRSDTWVHDMQMSASGDVVHMLVNSGSQGPSQVMHTHLMTLCARTGSLLNTAQIIAAPQSQASMLGAGVALSPWAYNGTFCSQRDCAMLIVTNLLLGGQPNLSSLKMAMAPFGQALPMETFSRAWLQIGVIPSEGPDGAGWSWVLTVIIFVTAILGVTAVATFSFWLCFYGYRSCGREQAGKTAVSASDDSGSEMDIQKRIAESEAGELHELGPQKIYPFYTSTIVATDSHQSSPVVMIPSVDTGRSTRTPSRDRLGMPFSPRNPSKGHSRRSSLQLQLGMQVQLPPSSYYHHERARSWEGYMMISPRSAAHEQQLQTFSERPLELDDADYYRPEHMMEDDDVADRHGTYTLESHGSYGGGSTLIHDQADEVPPLEPGAWPSTGYDFDEPVSFGPSRVHKTGSLPAISDGYEAGITDAASLAGRMYSPFSALGRSIMDKFVLDVRDVEDGQLQDE